MTVQGQKMFLAVSRDSSTDKHKKRCEHLSHFTMSDKRQKTKNFNDEP